MRAIEIRLSDVMACPIHSLSPSHYRPDGSCYCVPRPGERRRVVCSCGCGATLPDDGCDEAGRPLSRS